MCREERLKGNIHAHGTRLEVWIKKSSLRKVCVLAPRLTFFQYDSILVRNKHFGCSSRTEPVVNENLGQRALLLSEDPLSSLPKSVCSGSGRNTEPNTYVSDMRHCVCHSQPSVGRRVCQLVTSREIHFTSSPTYQL